MSRERYCSLGFVFIFVLVHFFSLLSVYIWFLKSNRNTNKEKVDRTDLPLSLQGFPQHHWSLSASWRGHLKVSCQSYTGFATSADPWHLQPFKTYPKLNAVLWHPSMALTNRDCFASCLALPEGRYIARSWLLNRKLCLLLLIQAPIKSQSTAREQPIAPGCMPLGLATARKG